MNSDICCAPDKRLADIRGALEGAQALVLATDPDREGEAISWHLTQELQVLCSFIQGFGFRV